MQHMNEQRFTLQYPWDCNGYKPPVTFYLNVEVKGFQMRVVVEECNPRRMEKQHQNFVHNDSCVEWFVNFCPETNDKYFNFEVNPNGTMYAAIFCGLSGFS